MSCMLDRAELLSRVPLSAPGRVRIPCMIAAICWEAQFMKRLTGSKRAQGLFGEAVGWIGLDLVAILAKERTPVQNPPTHTLHRLKIPLGRVHTGKVRQCVRPGCSGTFKLALPRLILQWYANTSGQHDHPGGRPVGQNELAARSQYIRDGVGLARWGWMRRAPL